MNKLTKYLILLVGITVMLFTGCQDLEVENLNSPDKERALANPADLVSLLNGAKTTYFNTVKERGNHVFTGLSDQSTGTNAYYGWWDMAIEPKPRLNNEPTYADAVIFSNFWDGYNNVIFTANLIIEQIVIAETIIEVDGVDLTQDILASCYFLRGLGVGHLGLIYDKAYIITEETFLPDVDPTEFATPEEMVAEAVANFELAKAVASANSITFDFIGTELESDEFIALANSYAAKFLINVARNEAQLADYTWATILKYAQSGIESDFTFTSTDDIYSVWNLVASFTVNGGDGHYQYTDLKVINLMDPAYPIRYPTDATVLGIATSDDDRLVNDWVFDNDFGFLRESRGRHLFSTYAHIRWDADLYDDGTYAGIVVPMFTVAELELIEAEVLTQTGATADAKGVIDNGARSTRGGLPALDDDAKQTLLDAIYYEYCVEMFNVSQGIQFYNMRRYNRLQKGTALHLAIPGAELEINALEYYTFGGEAYADGENTADGSNSWDN
ncbi:MAG: RagB/SusD family nutrient uptake outer membrane protein [Bacteroidales bacterium]|nr:RagB/SusD family nutrient uptake outer membrane protein [Bacteroidales bacterium]